MQEQANSTSPPPPPKDVALSNRLEEVAKKHVGPQRRLSIDILSSPATGPANPVSPSKTPQQQQRTTTTTATPSEPPTASLRAVTSALSTTLATPVDVTSSAVLCPHRSLLDQTTLKCINCSSEFLAFERLKKDVKAVEDEWRRAKRGLSGLADKSQTAAQDLIHLHTRIDALALKAKQSADVSATLKASVVVETGRVLDEIEKRLELQSIRDKLVEEIEDKTQELFEKANGLVADEAKRRFGSQTRVRALEGELDDLQGQLAMERMQLSELRAKMEELRLEKDRMDAEGAAEEASSIKEMPSDYEESIISEYDAIADIVAKSVMNDVASNNSDSAALSNDAAVVPPAPIEKDNPVPAAVARHRNSASPVPEPSPTMEMDQQLLSDLHIFMKECGPLKLNKLHTLPFLKTCLEEDVLPCLKFGGNPRTNTKKLVDAILVNMCFVEEMNATQIAGNKEYHATLKRSLDVQAEYAARSSNSSSTSFVNTVTTTATSASSAVSTPAPSTPNASPSKFTIQQANQSLLLANTSTKDSPTHQLFTKSVLQTLSGWASSTPTTVPSSIVLHGCPTCGLTPTPTSYHFKISDSPGDKWIPICKDCRNRLVAVCEFYNFVRHLKLGLYSTRGDAEVYGEVVQLRVKMWEARCGGGFAGVGSLIWGFSKEKGLGGTLRPDSVLFLGLKNE
ncbi:UNVERIFIED_CONTAM: hypothetical protein HDU68_008746 [Siphonaria sp. JEL0065]|nr:hypothetical protein HDU68_008746 [Siphonaria sp. JEL0065]